MRLETERLLLRRSERPDLDGYMTVFGDPKVTRFLGRGGARSRQEVSNGLDSMIRHWDQHGIGLFTVRRKEDDLLLGRVGFLLWDEERWVNAMHEEPQGPTETELAGRSRTRTGTRATRPRARSPAATGRSESAALHGSSR